MEPLAGKRVLVLGAETPLGQAVVCALAAAGARPAPVAAVAHTQSAFSVQRLARRVGALGRAIDATNEMAVRVAVRQVSRQLGGLDAIVCCSGSGDEDDVKALALLLRFGGRELARTGGGAFLAVAPRRAALGARAPAGVALTTIETAELSQPADDTVARVLHAIAVPANNR